MSPPSTGTSGAQWFIEASKDHGKAIFVVFHYPESLLENALFAQPCAKRGGKRSRARAWPRPPLALCPASQPPYLCIGGRRTFP